MYNRPMADSRRKSVFVSVSLLLLLSASAFSASETLAAGKTLKVLASDYWETYLEERPTYATFLGDHRYNDRLEDLGPESRKKRKERLKGFLRRMGRIRARDLSGADRTTYGVLKETLELELERQGHKLFQWDVDHMFGPQTHFPQLMNYHPLKTEKDVQDLLARFRAYPDHVGQYLGNLEEGLREGRAAACLAVRRVHAQAEVMLKTPVGKSPFGKKVGEMPSSLARRHRKPALDTVQNYVYPAYESLRDFMGGENAEYPKKCRDDARGGIWSLPGGGSAYRFLIREHTTTRRTEEDIHQLGLRELKRIHEEMKTIQRRAGHSGDLKAFLEKVKSDPKNFFSTRREVEESARKHLSRAKAKLPAYFGTLPKASCEVKPIEDYREKDAVAAFYYEPPMDGSRPGIYYVNTYNPPSRARYTATALAVHEAVPGHHLQIALAHELEGLPKFRQYLGHNSFVEGWALYAELLAEEMGLYPDDLSRLGMLTYQAWRATRLVVDTGLHAKKWPRQKAIDFMMENSPLSEAEIVNEVDRYVIWPGQALAYKIGQLEISGLRKKAEERLGSRFDLRRFHDAVLLSGSLPLSTLKDKVEDWIRTELGGSGKAHSP